MSGRAVNKVFWKTRNQAQIIMKLKYMEIATKPTNNLWGHEL